MHRIASVFLLACLVLAAAPPVAAQQRDCAMVLMHGKWGGPRYLVPFGEKLEPVCAVRSIEMPWSQRREYDQPYASAIEEIAGHVRELRAQGFRRVVLAGHSFGANAGLAYMAVRDDADAVVALAPGHSPQFMHARGINRDALIEARALVDSGRGDEKIRIEDLNQRATRSIRMTAATFLSYFEPQGLGNMVVSAGSFRKNVPVLMVVGTTDPVLSLAHSAIFPGLPRNAHSRLLVVEADHMSTLDAGAQQVSEWLKALP